MQQKYVHQSVIWNWIIFPFPFENQIRKDHLIIWNYRAVWNLQALWTLPSQWRHNGDGVSNHRRIDCILNRLLRRRSKKISKLRVTGLCDGIRRGAVNSHRKGPVTRKVFPFDHIIMQTRKRLVQRRGKQTHIRLVYVSNRKSFNCSILLVVGPHPF